MIVPSVAKLEPLGLGEFDVLDIPYFFEDLAAARRRLDGKLGQTLFSKLEPHGMKGLAYWDLGFKGFHSKKPIRSVSDFKGLKIPIQKNMTLQAEVKALSGTPVTTSVYKYVDGVKSGEFDAAESPLLNYMIGDLHQFHKYFTFTNHGLYGYAVLVNQTFWNTLNAKQQEQIQKALAQATQFKRELVEKETQKILAQIKQEGVVELIDLQEAEMQKLKSALLPVKLEFETRYGASFSSLN